MSGARGMKASKPPAVPPAASPHDNLLDLVDGRSLPVRAVRAAYAAVMADLGGEQRVSYAMRSLALRAANVETWLASVEARLLGGEKADADLLRSYLHGNNVLLGLYKTIGLRRVPKEIPSLQEFLSSYETPPEEPTSDQ